MGLPWFRMDSLFASHDKILALLADTSAKRWQAAFSWASAMGWSAYHGTDGRIPATALTFVHGTKATAELLVKYGLWEPVTAGYQIRNYDKRQQLAWVGETIRQGKSEAGQLGNHERWHVKRKLTDPDCPYCRADQEAS